MSDAPDRDVLRRLRRHAETPEEGALETLRVVCNLARLALLSATPALLHDDADLDLDDVYRERVRAARRLVASVRSLDRALDRYLLALDDERVQLRASDPSVDRWPFGSTARRRSEDLSVGPSKSLNTRPSKTEARLST